MKKIIVLVILIFCLILSGCQMLGGSTSNEDNTLNNEENAKSGKKFYELVSNMADDSSRAEVEFALKDALSEESVNGYFDLVDKYNNDIERTSLAEGFVEKIPEYDLGKIIDLWNKTHEAENFIGTNCRINTFMLLKNDITIGNTNSDDSLLFADKDAIKVGGIFGEVQIEEFNKLFSRVETEHTKDVDVHGKKMEAHLADIEFSEKARMVSVVIHDSLDGDYLFIGHVGVLVKYKDKYMFVEKLTFDEPYQALVFKTKEDCYKYLRDKYSVYTDENSAKPFIMDNNKVVLK